MKAGTSSIPISSRSPGLEKTTSTAWQWLGLISYAAGLTLQEKLREQLRQGGPEALVMLEHSHVYTLGRSASQDDIVMPKEWLASRGVEVYETDRGGQVTYHGPGQLVGYPILDLGAERDIRQYVDRLQEMLVAMLGDFGIEAHARHQQAEIGVWVGARKIASIGVHLSRWITTHGFALNVSTDLSYFQGIVACGLQGVQMTSIAQELGTAPSLPEVADCLVGHFERVLGRKLAAGDLRSPAVSP